MNTGWLRGEMLKTSQFTRLFMITKKSFTSFPNLGKTLANISSKSKPSKGKSGELFLNRAEWKVNLSNDFHEIKITFTTQHYVGVHRRKFMRFFMAIHATLNRCPLHINICVLQSNVNISDTSNGSTFIDDTFTFDLDLKHFRWISHK